MKPIWVKAGAQVSRGRRRRLGPHGALEPPGPGRGLDATGTSGAPSNVLLLVAMPGAPSSFLFLVVGPEAPSSVSRNFFIFRLVLKSHRRRSIVQLLWRMSCRFIPGVRLILMVAVFGMFFVQI